MASSGEDGRLHQAGGLIGVGSARCVDVGDNGKRIKARLPGASPLKRRLGRRGRERGLWRKRREQFSRKSRRREGEGGHLGRAVRQDACPRGAQPWLVPECPVFTWRTG